MWHAYLDLHVRWIIMLEFYFVIFYTVGNDVLMECHVEQGCINTHNLVAISHYVINGIHTMTGVIKHDTSKWPTRKYSCVHSGYPDTKILILDCWFLTWSNLYPFLGDILKTYVILMKDWAKTYITYPMKCGILSECLLSFSVECSQVNSCGGW